jgi:predicted Zn-dependent protease
LAAKEDTSITDLARDSPLATHAEEQLRLLNRLYPDGEPTPGQRLKTIE